MERLLTILVKRVKILCKMEKFSMPFSHFLWFRRCNNYHMLIKTVEKMCLDNRYQWLSINISYITSMHKFTYHQNFATRGPKLSKCNFTAYTPWQLWRPPYNTKMLQNVQKPHKIFRVWIELGGAPGELLVCCIIWNYRNIDCYYCQTIIYHLSKQN